MKIAVISDLHGNLIYYPSNYWNGLEECEVLFICGDIFPLRIQFNMPKCHEWLINEFIPWATELPIEKVYVIGGNHDAWFERNEEEARKLLSEQGKITYIKNNLIEHISIQDGDTYTIFGTPYCHIYGNWPFMRDEDKLRELFNEIPENIDILFSHDAPTLGTVGTILQYGSYNMMTNAGNPILSEFILEKKPTYCFCGHIHSGNHILEKIGDSYIANCSILDEKYNIAYPPLYLRVAKNN